jgi:hypothetical protein
MSNFFIIYILRKLEYKFNITLELENIKVICNYYNYNLLQIKLKKYNLFELIYLLNKLEFLSYINLNKKAIIDKLVINKIDINIDNKYNNSSIKLQWKIQKIKRQTYNIIIINNKCIEPIMEIFAGDIIVINKKEYIIYMRLYKYIILENNKTNEKKHYTIQELIDIFEHEDVTYIKSLHLNYNKKYIFD